MREPTKFCRRNRRNAFALAQLLHLVPGQTFDRPEISLGAQPRCNYGHARSAEVVRRLHGAFQRCVSRVYNTGNVPAWFGFRITPVVWPLRAPASIRAASDE